MRYKTKLEATHVWVEQMNAIPTDMIDRLMDSAPDEWEEVTDYELYNNSIYEKLPMWGTMWSFGSSFDEWWLEDEGIALMSSCGFRIYCHETWGYFFGIDAAGFDFYEAFWLPLYNKRGLQWHEE